MITQHIQERISKLPTINVLNKRCPSNQVLDLIADKWSVLIIYALRKETLRYSDLERMIDGISQKMLTQTLRKLECNGLIKRTVYPVVPPHVDYELTELGKSLQKTLAGLCRWAQDHMLEVMAAHEKYQRSNQFKNPRQNSR